MSEFPKPVPAPKRATLRGTEFVSSDPRDFGFSRWRLRVWHGMTFGAWRRVLKGNLGKVSPGRYGLLASVTVLSLGNSFLKLMTQIFLGQKLRETKIEPAPLFVLGHWRSGTTWLHQIIVEDPRHASPTAAQCFSPETFLPLQLFFGWLVKRLLPKTRPMDNVSVSAETAEEDEHGISLSGAVSPYRQLAFPCDHIQGTAMRAQDMPAHEQDFLEKVWIAFLKKVQFVNPGKRLVLKSPPHTVRLEEIMRLFPEARFVHIVRDPYKVLLSRIKSSAAMAATQSLQTEMPAGDDGLNEIIDSFVGFHEHHVEAAKHVPDGRMMTIRYEDLRADPGKIIREIYETLDLGPFDQVEPHVSAYLEAKKGYANNVYELPKELEETLDVRARGYFETYGYTRMRDRRGAGQ